MLMKKTATSLLIIFLFSYTTNITDSISLFENKEATEFVASLFCELLY